MFTSIEVNSLLLLIQCDWITLDSYCRVTYVRRMFIKMSWLASSSKGFCTSDYARHC